MEGQQKIIVLQQDADTKLYYWETTNLQAVEASQAFDTKEDAYRALMTDQLVWCVGYSELLAELRQKAAAHNDAEYAEKAREESRKDRRTALILALLQFAAGVLVGIVLRRFP